jgi:hypothetical protein
MLNVLVWLRFVSCTEFVDRINTEKACSMCKKAVLVSNGAIWLALPASPLVDVSCLHRSLTMHCCVCPLSTWLLCVLPLFESLTAHQTTQKPNPAFLPFPFHPPCRAVVKTLNVKDMLSKQNGGGEEKKGQHRVCAFYLPVFVSAGVLACT